MQTGLLHDSSSWVQSQVRQDLADRVEVPDGDVAIVAGNSQPPAVRTPRQPIDRADLIGQRIGPFASLKVKLLPPRKLAMDIDVFR